MSGKEMMIAVVAGLGLVGYGNAPAIASTTFLPAQPAEAAATLVPDQPTGFYMQASGPLMAGPF